MLNQPTSSPMMTRIFGRCVDRAAGGGACCWARAGLVNAAVDKADAASKELPLQQEIASLHCSGAGRRSVWGVVA